MQVKVTAETSPVSSAVGTNNRIGALETPGHSNLTVTVPSTVPLSLGSRSTRGAKSVKCTEREVKCITKVCIVCCWYVHSLT